MGWISFIAIMELLQENEVDMLLSVGCRMEPWTSWTYCTKSCGGGIQERFMNSKKQVKGTRKNNCKERKEIRACHVHPC